MRPVIVGGMGMLGELFPGRKLRDEAGEDGDGQPVREPWDIDLDSGVVRLRSLDTPPEPEKRSNPGEPPTPD